jgi:hypothetical protein
MGVDYVIWIFASAMSHQKGAQDVLGCYSILVLRYLSPEIKREKKREKRKRNIVIMTRFKNFEYLTRPDARSIWKISLDTTLYRIFRGTTHNLAWVLTMLHFGVFQPKELNGTNSVECYRSCSLLHIDCSNAILCSGTTHSGFQ